jgi:capsular exopolysaccharide synthesis family protein
MKPRRQSVIDAFTLESPFATEFRRLLQKVEQSGYGTEMKSLMVTSAMLSEGKSTVCSFLGITAAMHKGIKTLVIDCDLRRPALHKLFAVERRPGMSEILSEGYAPADAIRKTSIDKLDLLLAGAHHDEPTRLFDAEAISTVVESLKISYDLIIVDTAPILPVSDPMLLAPKLDAALMVVKAGATQQDVVMRALDILGPSRNRLLGVVMNNMNAALPYQYDYRYYGYEYKQSKARPPKVRGRGQRGRKSDSEGPGQADMVSHRSDGHG